MNKMLGMNEKKNIKREKLSFNDNMDMLSDAGDGAKVVPKLISMKKIANTMQDQILKNKKAGQALKAQLPILKECIEKFQGLLDQGSPRPSSAKPIMLKYAKLLKKVKGTFPSKENK